VKSIRGVTCDSLFQAMNRGFLLIEAISLPSHQFRFACNGINFAFIANDAPSDF
jgi:hypothetical protein